MTATITRPTMSEELSHAESNASGWMDTISAAAEAFDFCQSQTEGRWLSREAKACLKDHSYDGTNYEEVLQLIEQEVQESALSVEVRSGWVVPDERPEAEEYKILLSYGGPSLAIFGDLDQYGEPSSARLMHQDWGTPWIEYLGANRDKEALVWFASLFHFGCS